MASDGLLWTCPDCRTTYSEAVPCWVCSDRGKGKPSKYGNKRTKVDGITFDSKREADRYGELKLEQRAGEVEWFIRQPLFDLGGGTTYRADFLVVRRGEGEDQYRVEVEDVKGHRTQAYKRSKRQVEALYPIEVKEL